MIFFFSENNTNRQGRNYCREYFLKLELNLLVACNKSFQSIIKKKRKNYLPLCIQFLQKNVLENFAHLIFVTVAGGKFFFFLFCDNISHQNKVIMTHHYFLLFNISLIHNFHFGKPMCNDAGLSLTINHT